VPTTELEILKTFHLLAAAVWTGGLIVLGFTVSAIRSATDDRAVLQATARRFAWVSWTAMAVALATGVRMYFIVQAEPDNFILKWNLITVSIVLALAHQLTARKTPPAIRGLVQAVILGLAIAIFAAAAALPY
jgi:putative copper export protein